MDVSGDGGHPALSAEARDPEGLLPCPFCGGEPRVWAQDKSSSFDKELGMSPVLVWVHCPQCGGAVIEFDGRSADRAAARAREKWNRRAVPWALSESGENDE